MNDIQSQQLATLLEAVLSSAKYRDVCPDLIRSIGTQELLKRHSLKEAVKATKNKLHQVGGAYLEGQNHSAAWLLRLQQAIQTGNSEKLRTTCTHMLSYHASTRERLPMLAQFYDTIFAELPPVHSVLDLACGLNPLTLPWMPLSTIRTYYAYDIYQHMTDMLHSWLSLMGITGHARVCDITQTCPTDAVDVAFLFKTLPCLEQIDKQASSRLLHSIRATHLIVSYPLHSLGGRGKEMAAHYEAQFLQLVTHETWHVKRLEFATELVFVVKKHEN